MNSHKRSTQLERLEVVGTGRRRRWSDDEKLRIVTESFQAPRTITSTARRHGISRSLLMTWRRSFGPEPIRPQGEQSGFARVVIAAEIEPTVAAAPTSGQMVIVVCRGVIRRGSRRRSGRSSGLFCSSSFQPPFPISYEVAMSFVLYYWSLFSSLDLWQRAAIGAFSWGCLVDPDSCLRIFQQGVTSARRAQ